MNAKKIVIAIFFLVPIIMGVILMRPKDMAVDVVRLSPYDTIVPDIAFIQNIQNEVRAIAPDDRKILMRYFERKIMQKAKKIPEDNEGTLTIRQAIQFQLNVEEQAKKESPVSAPGSSELYAKIDDAHAISIQLLSKETNVADKSTKSIGKKQKKKSIKIGLTLKNQGAKIIKVISGKLVFSNEKGEVIKKADWYHEDLLNPGQEKEWHGDVVGSKQSVADEKLAATSLEKLKFEFTPEMILFADGTVFEAKKQ